MLSNVSIGRVVVGLDPRLCESRLMIVALIKSIGTVIPYTWEYQIVGSREMEGLADWTDLNLGAPEL